MIPVPKRDWQVYAILAGVSVLIRLPFLSNFNLVSYDGTYYINQAKVFWSGLPQPGSFPIGYPLFISLFLPLVGDGVRAAQIVSFLAAMGSLVVLYRLALRFLDRTSAFWCAAFLCVTPLFVRLSLETFSESLFTFFMLLTFWVYARGRDEAAGAAGGLAAITRPEMLGVAGILFALRIRTPRRALLFVLPFLLIFSLNALKFYQSNGRFTALPKSEFFGAGAQSWTEREEFIEDSTTPVSGGIEDGEKETGRPSVGEIAVNYISKFPREVYLLARNTGFVMLILAAFGMWRKPTFLLALLLPFVVGPLFTVRSLERYLLPYVPILILYGFIGADYLKETRYRDQTWSVMGIVLLLTLVLNTGHLTQPVDEGFFETKQAGMFLRDHIKPGDVVAGRKPYVAFYAGADYMEIPFDSYEGTLGYLVDRKVEYLSLHVRVLKRLRPIVANLLTNPAVVAGELRYRQVWGHEEGLVLYQSTHTDDPLRWKRIDNPGRAFDTSPDWSPDGEWVVFSAKVENHLDIFMTPRDGGDRQLVAGGPGQEDQPDWSPDGRFIAFSSTRDGNWNIFVLDRVSGDVRSLTNDPAHDSSPNWSPDGGTIYFMSERSGKREIWKIGASGGNGATRMTDTGANNFPAVSPDGKRLAWTRLNQGLAIMDLDTGELVSAAVPRQVNYKPAWSPDGRYIAVSGRDWGSVDIYLVTSDGGNGLLLTKNAQPGPDVLFDAMPAWSPDGESLAVISTKDGPQALYVLTGLGAYLERLDNPVRMLTFEFDD
jgi:hypothetical protein